MKYLHGFCYICGKGIYLNEPHKTDPNLVCEIIVCLECYKKAIELLKDATKEIEYKSGVMQMQNIEYPINEIKVDNHLQ